MASPFPLYNGTTLAVRQEVGGAYLIALSLRNDARLWIPFGPRNLSSCGGNLLRPLLLVALYLCSKMFASSLSEMRWWSGWVSGVKVSGSRFASWNIFLLYSVNCAMGTSTELLFFYFSIPQNCFGLYFSIVGSSN